MNPYIDDMHVAHFIQRYPPALGGSESYFARLSRFLAEQGDVVKVFTSNALDLSAFWSRKAQSLPVATELAEGVEVQRFACWRWPARRYLLKLLSFVPHRLWQCLMMPCNPVCPGMWRAAGKYDDPVDIVHASSLPYAWPIACARKLSRRRKVPFLLTPFLHLGDLDDPHDPTRRAYTAPQLRWLLKEADCLFAQTEGEYRAILALGIPWERVVLQGLGVDPSDCTGGDRSRVRQAWGVAATTPIVGLLANQSFEKGTIDLLQAMARVWQRGVETKLVLAGPEMPNFLAYWRSFQAHIPQHSVVRLGPLSADQKRDFFAGIDLFVLPSRSDSFGLVLLEAWANGAPNVGYRAGGVADVIRHEQDGLLAKCGDIAGLADAIELLLRRPELRQMYGLAGKARVERDFRWQDKLTLVRDQYQRLAASASS